MRLEFVAIYDGNFQVHTILGDFSNENLLLLMLYVLLLLSFLSYFDQCKDYHE